MKTTDTNPKSAAAKLMTAGAMTLPADSKAASDNVTLILDAAKTLGVKYPSGGGFYAGQVFFEESGPVEVRLAVVLPQELQSSEEEIEIWTTEKPPEIQYQDGQLRYNSDPQNRAHLSAAMNVTTEGAEMGLIFDFRGTNMGIAGANYILSDEPRKPQPRRKLPLSLAYHTFPEAKAGALAISDGRDGRNWRPIEGTLALLHAPKSAAHQVRFEPNNILVTWWGEPPANAESLWEELKKMDMDSVMLYHVALANILFDPKARFTASLDELIKAIGREGEAKRSAEKRAEWRRKVWRTLLLFDSLAIIGARSGTWRERGSQGEKRDKMAAEKLISRDALFRIIGTRETQGSFDNSEPPKEVSLVPGEWLMQFHGNREILSDFGDVLKIAAIPRGKAAGNWAACVGLMLNQLWRERAHKATRKRAGNAETLDFGTFTRRQLLEKTLRSDHDVNEILSDPKGRKERAQSYWKEAITKLKKAGVIGHYAQGVEPAHEDWRERWLDQPLDIRPKSAMPQALEIKASADKARRRTPRKKPPKLEEANDN